MLAGVPRRRRAAARRRTDQDPHAGPVLGGARGHAAGGARAASRSAACTPLAHGRWRSATWSRSSRLPAADLADRLARLAAGLAEEAAQRGPAASSRCSTPSRRIVDPRRRPCRTPKPRGTIAALRGRPLPLRRRGADARCCAASTWTSRRARRWRWSARRVSGKTTLTALVPRLYDVTGGRVLIGGVDVRDLRLDELRAHRRRRAFEDADAVLGQRAREPDPRPPRRRDARRARGARRRPGRFVHDLPEGLDTRIGEQGLSLSGGQRQRLALARAVLGRPARARARRPAVRARRAHRGRRSSRRCAGC